MELQFPSQYDLSLPGVKISYPHFRDKDSLSKLTMTKPSTRKISIANLAFFPRSTLFQIIVDGVKNPSGLATANDF